jgi:Leucine-rich repeat (LRR) protein
LIASHCCPCHVLQGEEQLQQLVLSSNALPALLPQHLSGLACLTRLDASRNRLADLPGLACLPQLRVLLLGRNRLQDSCMDHIQVSQQRR